MVAPWFVGCCVLLAAILAVILFKIYDFFVTARTCDQPVGELERPLISDGVHIHVCSNSRKASYDVEEACVTNEVVSKYPPGSSEVFPIQNNHLPHAVTEPSSKVKKHIVAESLKSTLKSPTGIHIFQDLVPKVVDQRSCLSLEVISGPSSGLHCYVRSNSFKRLPFTIGRVSCDLQLKDVEVSGKHAMINWNTDKNKWELTDTGSLNGTLLNSHSVNYLDSGSRHWSDPVDLSCGDMITLGSSSNIHVHITFESERQHVNVGMASDPMSRRQGGKKLPMEDVSYYQWPLPGIDQFGIFGICDGHGGAEAAISASKIIPKKVARILSDTLTRENVLLQSNAFDVLKVAFSQTEASLDHYYEGCTATVLLLWTDASSSFFVQCANVGDSACILNVNGRQIRMTSDHRVTSFAERLRISKMGVPLKEGESRMCGLNLGRMLGDKFLKEQDVRFSAEPFISEAIQIDSGGNAFILMASDGFWDVISVNKAFHLVLQAREHCTSGGNTAQKIADYLLSEARMQRTRDNTSIIYLDFGLQVNSNST